MITQKELIENLAKSGQYIVMNRINYNGYRLYVQEDPFCYYSGISKALKNSTFSGNRSKERLDNWRSGFIDSLGEKAVNDYVGMTADFGTLVHSALVTIKENGCLNNSEEYEKAENYFIESYKSKGLEPDKHIIPKMAYQYQKQALSMMQFIYDRVESIYAIETMCKSESLKIATPIDLVCSCRQTEKGSFEKTTINVKTSDNFNEEQVQQVSFERAMWNETYNEEVQFTALWKANNWKEKNGVPTYSYKSIKPEESDEIYNKSYNRVLMCLNDPDSSYYPNPVSYKFSGTCKLGEKPELIMSTLEQEWVESKELEELEN